MFKYKNGKIISEKEYAQELTKNFLAEHLRDDSIKEIEILEDAKKYIQNMFEKWTIDTDTIEIIENKEKEN